MEWEERSQQASALEARLAAREAVLREREDSFEAQVRPLNTVSSYKQPRGYFDHQIFSHLARQASHLSEAAQCRAASAGLFTSYSRLLGIEHPSPCSRSQFTHAGSLSQWAPYRAPVRLGGAASPIWRYACRPITFSAFWLRSSVVSVLISLISDMSDIVRQED